MTRGRGKNHQPVAILAFLTLWGITASHAAVRPQSQSPKPLLQIGVEVVEVDEQKTEKLGISWLNSLHIEEATAPALFAVGTLARGKLFADLEFMMQKGTADLLANPKLVTRDGTTATFHAGGELPYATSGSLGTVNVEFKPYGVNLKINPHIDETGQIAMELDAEVSGPDEQNSVTLSGNVVPGIRSRRVNSQITLKPGSTLTMAGLIQNEKQHTRTGIPGLMQIPLLGRVFSHQAETSKRTSIVVFVTPTILEGPFSAAPTAALRPLPTAAQPVHDIFESSPPAAVPPARERVLPPAPVAANAPRTTLKPTESDEDHSLRTIEDVYPLPDKQLGERIRG